MNPPLRTFLESWLNASAALVPDLVAEGWRIGKVPYCVDGLAEMMAAAQLPPSFAQETKQESDQRHLEAGGHCAWCQAYRWEALDSL